MYLQLAEGQENMIPLQENETQTVDQADLYLYIPAHLSPTRKGQYVREDVFDYLPEDRFAILMDVLDPFQDYNNSMSLFGLGKKARERREARRDDRLAGKLAVIKARGEARTQVASAGGGVGNFISDLIGNVFGGSGGEIIPEGEPIPEKKGLPTVAWIGIGLAGLVGLALLLKPKKA